MSDFFKFSAADEKNLTQGEKGAITDIRKKVLSGELSSREGNLLAEEYRAGHGYNGGADGSGYFPLDFSYDKQAGLAGARKRASRYTMEDFLQSEQYANMLDRYTKAGKAAMKDTVGDAAARTGGMASSYAAAAGQDSYNRYMQGLEDAAQQAYEQEWSRRQAEMKAEENREQTAYNRYLDSISLNNDLMDRAAAAEKEAKAEAERAAKQATERVDNQLGIGGKLADLPQIVLDTTGLTQAELEQREKYNAGLLQQNQAGAPAEPVYDDLVYVVADKMETTPANAQRHRELGSADWTQALEKLGLQDPGKGFASPMAKKWQQQYDMGRMTAAEIATELNDALNAKPPQIGEEEAELVLSYIGH